MHTPGGLDCGDVLVALPGFVLAYAVADHDVEQFGFGGVFSGVAELLGHVEVLAAVAGAGYLAGVVGKVEVDDFEGDKLGHDVVLVVGESVAVAFCLEGVKHGGGVGGSVVVDEFL